MWGAALCLSHVHCPHPREFPQTQSLPFFFFPFLCSFAACSDYSFTGGEVVSTVSALLPPLSFHIQDVSFRKHKLIPPIWPAVCFSCRFSEQTHTYFLYRRRWNWEETTLGQTNRNSSVFVPEWRECSGNKIIIIKKLHFVILWIQINCIWFSAVTVRDKRHCSERFVWSLTAARGCSRPFRGRLHIYTGSPVLGKPRTTPPPTDGSNRHYYCIR